jgi:hypothetical protein
VAADARRKLKWLRDTAKNQMMDIEKLSDEELDVIHEKDTQMRADCIDDEDEPKARLTRPSAYPE